MNKSSKRKALGRGLSNLIPIESEDTDSVANGSVEVEVSSITANPFQPRHEFNEEEIDGLAASIKSQGLLQPVVLRKKVDGYEIISGERRFRAMKKLNWDKIPAIIKSKVSDREMLELALVENIQRQNLNDIETALAYQQLLLDCGLSHEELSERVGKSRSSITNYLRLLKLPAAVQNSVRKGAIAMGHARAILAIDDAKKQKEIAEQIVENKLSVRDVEDIIKIIKGEKTKGNGKKRKENKEIASLDPDLQQCIERLQYRFGTSVKLSFVNNEIGKGKFEIKFHSNDDLTRIMDLLLP